jgi:hypothetical protein
MDLKELLGDDLYKQVTDKLAGKHTIAVISDGSYFPKAKWDEINEKYKEAKKQVDERDAQIAELGKKSKGNEDLSAEIERLKSENIKQATEAAERYKKARITAAVQLAATKAKARDAADIERFIDPSKLTVDADGNVTGIDEQFTVLQTGKAYLFEADGGNGGTNPAGGAPKGEIEQLQAQYDAAVKSGNTVAMVSAKNKLFLAQQQK